MSRKAIIISMWWMGWMVSGLAVAADSQPAVPSVLSHRAARAEPAAPTRWVDPNFDEEEWTRTLDHPTNMAFAPDGRLFVCERDGRLRVVSATGELLPSPFVTVPVSGDGDRGLLGVAFHPHFESNGYVYIYYVTPELPAEPESDASRISRVVRLIDRGNFADPDSQVVVVDSIPSHFQAHSGGALSFQHSPEDHEDELLLIGTGDGATWREANRNSLGALDIDLLSGKILRVADDGTPPESNPFYDGPTADRSFVYAIGVREPYAMDVRSGDGMTLIAEVGWNAWEEINRVEAGGNLGWPCYEGTGRQPAYLAEYPVLCGGAEQDSVYFAYPHVEPDGGCAVGAAFYEGTEFSDEYQGNFFFADCTQKWIRRLVLDDSGAVERVEDVAEGDSTFFPVDVDFGPDGALYYLWHSDDPAVPSGSVWRMEWVGDGNHGPDVVASADPSSGYAPLVVGFSSEGTVDVDGDTLSFHWDFGDGDGAQGENPTHVYDEDGDYDAVLTVSDGMIERSATVRIVVGSLPPVPVISTPGAGDLFADDVPVFFSGNALDPDEGELDPDRLQWSVVLHHNSHYHPWGDTTGTGGSFLPTFHDSTGGVSFEVLLTAIDDTGLSSGTSVILEPATRNRALNRPVEATSSYVVQGVGFPEHGNDGLLWLDEEMIYASCWQSDLDEEELQAWTVDLEGYYNIDMVVVRARLDRDHEGCRRNFIVEATNDPLFERGVEVIAELGNETFDASSAWGANASPINAYRYVRIRKTLIEPGGSGQPVFFNFGEFEIYGSPRLPWHKLELR